MNIDKTALTPMMRQYLETKENYPDCILLYRLGDFYEMFFEDAKLVSKVLELTLTGKSCGLEERAPMCGIPYHALEGYLNRLVEQGYKVAICEQVEDPAKTKGIVKREVVRIVTPGTNLDSRALEASKNHYIMCIFRQENSYGLSVADVTTGEFLVTELLEFSRVLDELYKFQPAELLCNEEFLKQEDALKGLKEQLSMVMYSLENWRFDEDSCRKTLLKHFQTATLAGLGLSDAIRGMRAAGALLFYLQDTQKTSLAHLSQLNCYIAGNYMLLDSFTRRNLELCETMREKKKKGSLLWVLDQTRTAMGARTLRKYVEQPLVEEREIQKRLEAVEEFTEQEVLREELREYLQPIYDLERLIGRITYQTANPRDLVAFQSSLMILPSIQYLLAELQSPLLKELAQQLDPLSDLCQLVGDAICEEPPVTLREGGILRDGYHAEVDELRRAKTEGKNWLAKLEEEEREKTGIKNLRIRFNKVFGYYLEVTKSFQDKVPEDYIRKQTLSNAERYSIPKLKELEDKILGAEDRLCTLEYELFCEIRNRICEQVTRIQKTAKIIAQLDVFSSLAYVAVKEHYVRPMINQTGEIEISEGRHPVVEKMIGSDFFIPNDTCLDLESNRIAIITGPNMAGKSTYMRQTALIVLMAQIGSFVPAKSANIGLTDRIFTRVGASDDLASGQSTFMVEMTEVSNILRNATRNSLLILDEIGRGTSTFDGLSIAWAVVEYIDSYKLLGARTLFATHYHELTELEGKLAGVNNYCIAVKEQGENIVFLRKILAGGADKSYGIQVAKLAGVPEIVISRAKEIMKKLSTVDTTGGTAYLSAKELSAKASLTEKALEQREEMQITLFDIERQDRVLSALEELELGRMTPLEALNTLYQLQEQLKQGREKEEMVSETT